jgi:hypothetical protein
MKCCASPTTSIAADPREQQQQRTARDVMSAVLFREILKPLAAGLGPVGEIALGAVADELFVRRDR